MRRWSVILILLVLGNSCATNRGKIVYDRYLSGSYEGKLKEGVVRIQGVSVFRSFDAKKIEENTRYILSLLFQKRNEAKIGAFTFSLEVTLKEDSFIRDYRAWNTVTVELSLLDDTTRVFTALYTEDTESTLSSYSYLYSLLERASREVR